MDANAILSALSGGKASRVFVEAKGVEFVTTANVAEEIMEYIPVLARKKGLERAAMEVAFSLLDLTVVPKDSYADGIQAAQDLIGKRDPDDVDILALILGCAIWSNDNDLKNVEAVTVYPTAVILRWLTGDSYPTSNIFFAICK